MKKIVTTIILIILLTVEMLTPISYAVDNEGIVAEEPVIDFEEEKAELDVIENEEKELIGNEDVETEEKNIDNQEGEGDLGEEIEVFSGDNVDNEEDRVIPEEVSELGTGRAEDILEITTGDISETYKTGVNDNNQDFEKQNYSLSEEENGEKKEKDGNVTGNNEGLIGTNNQLTGEILTGKEEKNEIDIAREKLNKQAITGTDKTKSVIVDVEAPVGTFPQGTELRIEPITKTKKLNQIREQIIDVDDTVEDDAVVVAFDISFIYTLVSGEEVELQPSSGNTVKVSFNYEGNRKLVNADKDDAQEVKVFHIEDKDENGEKVEKGEEIVSEIKAESQANENEGEIVVQAESFSTYAVTVGGNSYYIEWDDYVDTITLEGNGLSTYNNFSYGTLTIGNITIMDRNLGASEVWEYTDTWSEIYNESNIPESYGYYYQFGNNYGFRPGISPTTGTYQHDENTAPSTYSSDIWMVGSEWNSTMGLWGGWGVGAERQGPCPTDWHVPNGYEWEQLYNALGSPEGKKLAEALKLPPAGHRDSYLEFDDVGRYGFYWAHEIGNIGGTQLRFYGTTVFVNDAGAADYRSYGAPVRCFMNSYSKSLTFNATENGGTTTLSSIDENEGTTINLSDLTTYSAEKEGYDFVGWNTDPTAHEGLTSIELNEDTEVYAIFSKTVEATFSKNGATSIGSNSLHCTMWNNGESCTVTAPSITRTSWTIKGWNTNANATSASVNVGGTITLTANAQYYAITAKTNYVYFYANGATSVGTSEGYSLGYCNMRNTITSCTVTAPSITRDGWKILGWNTNANATSASVNVGGTITITSNKNYYAITSKQYTATFNANGATSIGSNSLPCTMWNNGELCTVTAPSITRDGREILGWDTNANATSASVEVGGTITLAANASFYAITKKECTANFMLLDPNAATLSSSISSGTVYNQGSCNISAPTLIPYNGYEAFGWSSIWGATENNLTTTFEAGNTYYSVTRNSTPFTVTYIIQDENAVIKEGGDTGCYRYNGLTECGVLLPTLTAKSGYTALGWSTDSNAIEADYNSNSSTPILGNVTYYSVTKNNTPITITFNVNGNKGDNSSLTCYKYNGSGSCSITSPNITPVNGFTEIGWSIATGTYINQWTGGTSKLVSDNAEYFAQSSKNVSATFKANNNKIDNDTSDIISPCTRYNGEGTCSITTPTITANGDNTPTVVGYTETAEGVSTATILSASSLSIVGGETYFAHTKKNAVIKQVTFNPNGNTKFKYGSNAESTTTASYDLCTIAETYDGTEQASNCSKSVTCPSITAHTNTPTVIGWSEGVINRTTVCTSEGTATLEGGKTYYAQTKKEGKNIIGTFELNGATSFSGAYIVGCLKSTTWNGEMQDENCDIVAPSITRDGWTKLGFNTDKFAESATFKQGEVIRLSSDTTYYAITKKEAIDLTANVNGNNSTISSDAQLTCTLEAVYNTGTQKTNCEVTMPTVAANTNTPNFIGWNIPSSSTTNNASYDKGTNKLTLTESNTNRTWYAITYSEDKVLHITYEIGTGVASIGKESDSCTLTGTYNGEVQATSCAVKAPAITVSEGYKDSDKRWTENGTNIIANVGANITLTQDSHYTAGAKYIANTNPMGDLQYTIRYEDQSGKTLSSSVTVGNQTFGTTVTVTALDIEGYIKPASQNITISVTNPDVVFVYAPREDIEYTVTYKDNNGNSLLTAKTVKTGIMDTDVTENAPEIDGYTVQTGTLSITLKAMNNHIDFVYTPNSNISYTVYYKSGNITLHTAKMVNNKTMGEAVTEYAENIPGYTVDKASKSLTLEANNNTITFNYTPNTNITYTVKYQTSSGSGLAEDKIVDGQTMASTVSEAAIEIAGYTVDQSQKSLTLAATNNVIIFVYSSIEYGIRFIDESNIHPTIVRSGDYLSVVDQNYPEWTRPGYDIHWDKSIPETMPLNGETIAASWTANTYTVRFNANQPGISNPDNQSVIYDSTYGTLPLLSKDGYTFNGWKDGDIFVTSESKYTTEGNKILVGDWTANTNTSYTVKHCKQSLVNENDYSECITEFKTGTTDTETTATVKSTTSGDFLGFTASNSVTQEIIAGNGSTVVTINYTRNSYDLEYKFTNTPSGHSTLPAKVSHKYEEQINIAENATAPGYSFVWDRTESFTMPAEDVTIIGTFTADTTTPYKVEYYYQQANGQYPTKATIVDTTRKGATDQPASVTNEDKTPIESGYAFDKTNTNNVLEGTIAGNGSLVLKVYFKKQFTVRYLTGERGTFEIQTTNNINYGTSTPNFEGSTDNHEDGYIFAGWSPNKSATVIENVDYVAQWYEDFNHNNQNDADEDKYTVTIIYVYSRGGTAAQTYSVSNQLSGFTYNVDSPDILNYYADKTNVSGKISENVNEVVTYTPITDNNHNEIADEEEQDDFHTLIIHYHTTKGGEVYPDYEKNIVKGASYRIPTNEKTNYIIEDGKDVIEGVMGDANIEITVIYRTKTPDTNSNGIADEDEPKYTLTIHYKNTHEGQITGDYTAEYVAGATYNVSSPITGHYTADPLVVNGIMPTDNHIETVIYTPDVDRNGNGIADSNEQHYTLTIHYKNAKNGKLYDDYIGSYVAGEEYEVSSSTSDSNYNIESGKEIVTGTMPAEDVEITVIYTAKIDANGNGIADEVEPHHTLTIHYINTKGATLFDDYVESIVEGGSYLIESEEKDHYTIDKPIVSGTMGEENIEITVIYSTLTEDTNDNGIADEEEIPHTLTIYYVYSRGEQASETITLNYLSGIRYSITTPLITNYIPNYQKVEGIMQDKDKEVTVKYRPNEDRNDNGYPDIMEPKYKVVVHYIYSGGGEAYADNIELDILSGLTYTITSPTIQYYEPNKPIVTGKIEGNDVEETVIYTPNQDKNLNGIADEVEPKYTVKYTDGVEGSIVFGDQTSIGLLSGLETPKFEGRIARKDYIFSGWVPKVEEKVYKNATYTATWKEDGNNNGIDDTTEEKYKITIKDGETVLAIIELIPGMVIKLPELPGKNGYTFDGWEGLPKDGKSINKDLEITARRKKIQENSNSTGGGGGGGGGGGSKNEEEHHSAPNTGEDKKIDLPFIIEKLKENVLDKWLNPINTNNNSSNSNEKEIEINTGDSSLINHELAPSNGRNSSYGSILDEIKAAYEWAYSKDITTKKSIEEANPEGPLYRQHMAKMMVNFAVNELGMEIPDETPRDCKWLDGSEAYESKEMEEYAVKACKLGLMGINIEYFNPGVVTTRAQFGTILSRLLFGFTYEGGDPYYKNHLEALKIRGIMTKIDNPKDRVELREWVRVMLMRVKDYKENLK